MKNLFYRLSTLFVCALLCISLVLPGVRAAEGDDTATAPTVTSPSDETPPDNSQEEPKDEPSPQGETLPDDRNENS